MRRGHRSQRPSAGSGRRRERTSDVDALGAAAPRGVLPWVGSGGGLVVGGLVVGDGGVVVGGLIF